MEPLSRVCQRRPINLRSRVGRGMACRDLHVVQGGDDGDLLAGEQGAKGLLEVRHGEDGAQQRAIVAVGTRAAEGDEDADCSGGGVSMDVTLQKVAIITGVV